MWTSKASIINWIHKPATLLAAFFMTLSQPGYAHDPIFGLGPHVLYKGGVELALHSHRAKQGDDKETEFSVEAVYGITGDWLAGIELPYVQEDAAGERITGMGDAALFTKYRFWRLDTFGAQESAAVALRLKPDTGADEFTTGTTDAIVGLTYGYESIKWYRWASARYRLNDKNDQGLERGNVTLLDFVAGWRPAPPSYLNADTVWLLELNGELIAKAKRNGASLSNTGGDQWFLSPGIFWTKRNFAIKAGLQIPVSHDLNGNQDKADYRTSLSVEWHL